MDGTNNVENSSSEVDCTQSILSTASSREELIWDNYSPPLHTCANGCSFPIHRRLSFQCASCGLPTSCSSCAVKWIDVQQQAPPGNGPLAAVEGNSVPETNASAGGDDESPKTEESKGPSRTTAAKRRRSDANCVQHNNRGNNNNTESSDTTSSLSLDFCRRRRRCSCEEEEEDDDDSTISVLSLIDGRGPLLSFLRLSDTDSAPSTSMSEGRCQAMSDLDRRRRRRTPPPTPRSRSVDAVRRRRRPCADGTASPAAKAKAKRNYSAHPCVRFSQTLRTRYKDDRFNCLSILKARECDDSSSSSENRTRSYVVLCSGSDTQFFEDCLPMDGTAARRECRIDCNRPAKAPCKERNLECRTKGYRCRPSADVDEAFRRNQRVRWCDDEEDDAGALVPIPLRGRCSSSSRRLTTGSEGRHRLHHAPCLGGLGSDDDCGCSYFVVTDPSLTSSEDVDLSCGCPFVENDCSGLFDRRFYCDADITAACCPDGPRGYTSDDCDCRLVRFCDNEIIYCEGCDEEEAEEECESDQELLFADELGIEDQVLSCEYPEFIPPLEYLLVKAKFSIEGDLETTRPSSRMFGVSPISEQELENRVVSGKLSLIRPTNELEVDETFEPGLVDPIQAKQKPSHASTQLAPVLNLLPRPASMADRSVKFSTADLSKVVNELKAPTFLRALIENFPIVRKTTLLKTGDSRDFRSIEPYFNKQSKGIGYQLVTYAYDTAATGTQRIFGMGSQEKLASGQMNTIASIVTAYPLTTTEVGDGPYPFGGLPMSYSADAVRESIRPSVAMQPRASAVQGGGGGVDATSTTSVVRLHRRSDSNPFGLTITHFTPHHEQHVVTAREDESSVEPSFNRVDGVPALEDLDIPVQSFTDASRYKTVSSNRYAPPREPSIKLAKKSDSNLKCLKELVAAAMSGQRTPSTTTTTTTSSNRYSDDGGGGFAGGLSDMLLEPLIGQIDVLLKNSLPHKYSCSSVTQVLSRPAKTPFVARHPCPCARKEEPEDSAARCGSGVGRSWLRFLSAKTICDRSKSCDDPYGYSTESTTEGGGRGGGGGNHPNITSTWVDRYNPPQSMFYDDPTSHDRCPCRTNREDSGTESITTIYSRLPASIQMRASTLSDDATLPSSTESCIPCPLYSCRPEPKPSAMRSGRHKARTVEFAANCKPSDDIISSTVIASRKRHPKTGKYVDDDDDDDADKRSKEKDARRKYKTLKHYCIKEFGRTRSLFDTLKPDN